MRLSEDWLATLIGLAIVVTIALGILGPGPQTVTVKVAAGETGEAELVADTGWNLTAQLKKEDATVEGAITDFSRGNFYTITCEDGRLTMQQNVGASSNSEKAFLTVTNNCDQPVTITYKLDPAVPWPVFGLFDSK